MNKNGSRLFQAAAIALLLLALGAVFAASRRAALNDPGDFLIRGTARISLGFFMVFVIVNSTVVFESGAIRWVAAAVLAGLFAFWVRRFVR